MTLAEGASEPPRPRPLTARIGAAQAVPVHRLTRLRRVEIEAATLYHFEHDPHGIFHPQGGGSGAEG